MKHFTLIYVLYLIFKFTLSEDIYPNTATLSDISEDLIEDLERARRNSICCAKKMRCCNLPPPNIEIRAILTRCPSMGKDPGIVTRKIVRPIITDSEYYIKKFQGFDEDEPLIQSELVKCKRKILLTLKVRNNGKMNCKAQFIAVDHVYDPATERNVRLLNPYVIMIKQEPIYKTFPLAFLDYVNSEAREQVYNKHDGNYTGCFTDKGHSTCGIVKYEGKVIPYSQGFCCSCDLKKNSERQPDSYNDKNEEIISYSDPAYLLDAVQCPRPYIPNPAKYNSSIKRQMGMSLNEISELLLNASANKQTTANDKAATRWTYSTYAPHRAKKGLIDQGKDVMRQKEEYMKKLRESFGSNTSAGEYGQNIRKKKQTFPSGIQKRGGQNCADRYTPPHVDPIAYHESTHCLRFSDVWYGIYKIGEDSVEQIIYIKVFERFVGPSGATRWRQITNANKTIRIGSRYPHYHDPRDQITITMTSKATQDTDDFTKLYSKRLLIPEGVKACDIHKYPEMKNGPEEYLVISPPLIVIEGNQCDRIGVGFEAFYKQPMRCSKPRGTCLRNQPKHLWKHDHKLAKRNKTGCYWLKYFANITATPIMVNKTTGDQFLQIEYRGHHMSLINMEINADFNTIIRPQPSAVITEVYIDSTCAKETIIMIKIINSGLISSMFMVQLADVPLDLPEEVSAIHSGMILIPPQNQHIFTLVIRIELPTDLFHCSVEVLDAKHELVALRRIRIQKFDRCICTWHCLCACIASNTGIKCRPMSLEHYHAAGFQGDLPVPIKVIHFTLLDDIVSVMFYFSLFLLATLLAMGLTKALLGLCSVTIAYWGLGVILDLPKPMKHYYERRLIGKKVIYDSEGWPIDPNTKARVRNLPLSTQFCANVVFFFIYPCASLGMILRRLCCPYYTARPRSTKKTANRGTTSPSPDTDTYYVASPKSSFPYESARTVTKGNVTTINYSAIKSVVADKSKNDKKSVQIKLPTRKTSFKLKNLQPLRRTSTMLSTKYKGHNEGRKIEHCLKYIDEINPFSRERDKCKLKSSHYTQANREVNKSKLKSNHANEAKDMPTPKRIADFNVESTSSTRGGNKGWCGACYKSPKRCKSKKLLKHDDKLKIKKGNSKFKLDDQVYSANASTSPRISDSISNNYVRTSEQSELKDAHRPVNLTQRKYGIKEKHRRDYVPMEHRRRSLSSSSSDYTASGRVANCRSERASNQRGHHRNDKSLQLKVRKSSSSSTSTSEISNRMGRPASKSVRNDYGNKKHYKFKNPNSSNMDVSIKKKHISRASIRHNRHKTLEKQSLDEHCRSSNRKHSLTLSPSYSDNSSEEISKQKWHKNRKNPNNAEYMTAKQAKMTKPISKKRSMHGSKENCSKKTYVHPKQVQNNREESRRIKINKPEDSTSSSSSMERNSPRTDKGYSKNVGQRKSRSPRDKEAMEESNETSSTSSRSIIEPTRTQRIKTDYPRTEVYKKPPNNSMGKPVLRTVPRAKSV